MKLEQSRRRFLATLSSAGVVGVIGAPNSIAQEAPPETTTIRMPTSSLCLAPLLVAGELLRGEGFTDIRYVPTDTGMTRAQLVTLGQADLPSVTTLSLPAMIQAVLPI